MTTAKHSHSRSDRRRGGFTLLEILVAVAVMSLLLFAAFRSLQQLSRVREAGLSSAGRERIAQLAMDRIERELVGTLLIPLPEKIERTEHPWLFVGTDNVVSGAEGDSLIFVTESPARAASQTAQELRYVAYQVSAGDEADELALHRTERVLPDKLEKDLPSLNDSPIVKDVALFSLSYVDDKSGGTLPAWDSTSEELKDRLPTAVDVKLQLYSRKPDGARITGALLQRRVPLFVRPIGGDKGECGEKVSLDDCLSRFQESLQALSAEEQQAITVLKGQIQGKCYDPDNDPQVQALRAALRELTGLDAAEVCTQQ